MSGSAKQPVSDLTQQQPRHTKTFTSNLYRDIAERPNIVVRRATEVSVIERGSVSSFRTARVAPKGDRHDTVRIQPSSEPDVVVVKRHMPKDPTSMTPTQGGIPRKRKEVVVVEPIDVTKSTATIQKSSVRERGRSHLALQSRGYVPEVRERQQQQPEHAGYVRTTRDERPLSRKTAIVSTIASENAEPVVRKPSKRKRMTRPPLDATGTKKRQPSAKTRKESIPVQQHTAPPLRRSNNKVDESANIRQNCKVKPRAPHQSRWGGLRNPDDSVQVPKEIDDKSSNASKQKVREYMKAKRMEQRAIRERNEQIEKEKKELRKERLRALDEQRRAALRNISTSKVEYDHVSESQTSIKPATAPPSSVIAELQNDLDSGGSGKSDEQQHLMLLIMAESEKLDKRLKIMKSSANVNPDAVRRFEALYQSLRQELERAVTARSTSHVNDLPGPSEEEFHVSDTDWFDIHKTHQAALDAQQRQRRLAAVGAPKRMELTTVANEVDDSETDLPGSESTLVVAQSRAAAVIQSAYRGYRTRQNNRILPSVIPAPDKDSSKSNTNIYLSEPESTTEHFAPDPAIAETVEETENALAVTQASGLTSLTPAALTEQSMGAADRVLSIYEARKQLRAKVEDEVKTSGVSELTLNNSNSYSDDFTDASSISESFVASPSSVSESIADDLATNTTADVTIPDAFLFSIDTSKQDDIDSNSITDNIDQTESHDDAVDVSVYSNSDIVISNSISEQIVDDVGQSSLEEISDSQKNSGLPSERKIVNDPSGTYSDDFESDTATNPDQDSTVSPRSKVDEILQPHVIGDVNATAEPVISTDFNGKRQQPTGKLYFSPEALYSKAVAELQLWDAMDESIIHLSNVNSARQIAEAQREAAVLAEMLGVRKEEHESIIKQMKLKTELVSQQAAVETEKILLEQRREILQHKEAGESELNRLRKLLQEQETKNSEQRSELMRLKAKVDLTVTTPKPSPRSRSMSRPTSTSRSPLSQSQSSSISIDEESNGTATSRTTNSISDVLEPDTASISDMVKSESSRESIRDYDNDFESETNISDSHLSEAKSMVDQRLHKEKIFKKLDDDQKIVEYEKLVASSSQLQLDTLKLKLDAVNRKTVAKLKYLEHNGQGSVGKEKAAIQLEHSLAVAEIENQIQAITASTLESRAKFHRALSEASSMIAQAKVYSEASSNTKLPENSKLSANSSRQLLDVNNDSNLFEKDGSVKDIVDSTVSSEESLSVDPVVASALSVKLPSKATYASTIAKKVNHLEMEKAELVKVRKHQEELHAYAESKLSKPKSEVHNLAQKIVSEHSKGYQPKNMSGATVVMHKKLRPKRSAVHKTDVVEPDEILELSEIGKVEDDSISELIKSEDYPTTSISNSISEEMSITNSGNTNSSNSESVADEVAPETGSISENLDHSSSISDIVNTDSEDGSSISEVHTNSAESNSYGYSEDFEDASVGSDSKADNVPNNDELSDSSVSTSLSSESLTAGVNSDDERELAEKRKTSERLLRKLKKTTIKHVNEIRREQRSAFSKELRSVETDIEQAQYTIEFVSKMSPARSSNDHTADTHGNPFRPAVASPMSEPSSPATSMSAETSAVSDDTDTDSTEGQSHVKALFPESDTSEHVTKQGLTNNSNNVMSENIASTIANKIFDELIGDESWLQLLKNRNSSFGTATSPRPKITPEMWVDISDGYDESHRSIQFVDDSNDDAVQTDKTSVDEYAKKVVKAFIALECDPGVLPLDWETHELALNKRRIGVSDLQKIHNHLVFDCVNHILVDLYCTTIAAQSDPWVAPRRSLKGFRSAPAPSQLEGIVLEKLGTYNDLQNSTDRAQNLILSRQISIEEDDWVDYSREEAAIKVAVADMIFDDILCDSLVDMKSLIRQL